MRITESLGNNMPDKSIRILFFGFVLFTNTLYTQWTFQESGSNRIVATASQELSILPDHTDLIVVIELQGLDKKEISSELATAVKKLKTLLKGHVLNEGFENLTSPSSPRTISYPSKKPSQHTAFYNLSVRIEKNDEVRPLIESILQIEGTAIERVLPKLRPDNPHYLKALSEALAAAKKKAEHMAQGLGVVLGDLLVASENNRSLYPSSTYRSREKNHFLKNVVTVHVSVTYAID